jgi:citrate synthase
MVLSTYERVLSTDAGSKGQPRRKPVTIHPVHELCRRYSFEEVAYLQWHGELPSPEQLTAQNRLERVQRTLGPQAAVTLAGRSPSPRALTTLLRILGLDECAHDDPATVSDSAALRLFAVVPSVVAANQRLRHGLGVIAPREHLGYAANLLCMTLGKVPSPQVVAAFETSLILYAGQGPNATSVFPDLYQVVGPAIGTLRGSNEASATRAIITMVNDIAIPDNARPWVEETLAAGRTIPGFGQLVDIAEEASVAAMRGALGVIASSHGSQHLLSTYEAICEAVGDATGLSPMLDLPASLAFQLVGFDAEAFVPLLTVAQLPSRTVRLARHLAADSLIRRRAASASLAS